MPIGVLINITCTSRSPPEVSSSDVLTRVSGARPRRPRRSSGSSRFLFLGAARSIRSRSFAFGSPVAFVPAPSGRALEGKTRASLPPRARARAPPPSRRAMAHLPPAAAAADARLDRAAESLRASFHDAWRRHHAQHAEAPLSRSPRGALSPGSRGDGGRARPRHPRRARPRPSCATAASTRTPRTRASPAARVSTTSGATCSRTRAPSGSRPRRDGEARGARRGARGVPRRRPRAKMKIATPPPRARRRARHGAPPRTRSRAARTWRPSFWSTTSRPPTGSNAPCGDESGESDAAPERRF